MKQLAKSTRELGRKIANMDGKYKGVTQAEGERVIRTVVNLVAAEIILGRTSVMKLIRVKAEKKAKAYSKKHGIPLKGGKI